MIVDPNNCDKDLGVTMKFKICNDNEDDLFINDFMTTLLVDEEIVDLSVGNHKIPPGQCKKVSQIDRTFDACNEKKNYPMSFEMNDGSGCKIRDNASFQFSEALAEPCKSQDFLITEISYPNYAWNEKFVEIYNPNCAGETINEDVNFIRYPGELNRHEPKLFNLKGMTIGEDGFLLICSENAGGAYGKQGMCDLIADDVGPTMPHDAFEIATKKNGIIDSYGYPSLEKDHLPAQRAVRKEGSQPSSTYNPDDWYFNEFALVGAMTPREWNP